MDFNAERQAREKIAGEKADLLEEIRRLKNGQLYNESVINEVYFKPSITLICATCPFYLLEQHFLPNSSFIAYDKQLFFSRQQTETLPDVNHVFLQLMQ